MRRTQLTRLLRSSVAVLCAALLVPAGTLPYARSAHAQSADDEAPPLIPADQLDSLVAPIALHSGFNAYLIVGDFVDGRL